MIAQAAIQSADNIHAAILLILASCVFDLLDGRLARLGGTDSDFGREFDSLADRHDGDAMVADRSRDQHP